MSKRAFLAAGTVVVIAAVFVFFRVASRATVDTAAGAATPAQSSASPDAGSPASRRSAATRTTQSKPVDDRPFTEMRAELERRALAGDAAAARRLGLVLANCNGYRTISDEELERWVVRMTPNGSPIRNGDSETTPEAFLASLTLSRAQKDRECKNVFELEESDALSKAFQWIERGAALGDADSQALYGSLAFSSYTPRTALANAEEVRERKQHALDYLQKSLAQGDALALLHLSMHYASGDIYAQSAETAYAYLHAYSLTARASDYVPGMLDAMLTKSAKALDEAALQRARDEGVRLAACCEAAAQ